MLRSLIHRSLSLPKDRSSEETEHRNSNQNSTLRSLSLSKGRMTEEINQQQINILSNQQKSMNMSEKKFDYTKAVAELDEIAAKVEDPATSLDDIGALVKRSKELIESCRQYLRTVRDSIEEDKD